MPKTMIVAGGCFWGIEALFRKESGVLDTEVGYTGGKNDNPTYESHSGHAEALQIIYDTDVTTYQTLLNFFFRIHNPTTLNQQGNDKGSSYRSAIFTSDAEEIKIAEETIDMVNESGKWGNPVVTTIEPLTHFWSAEDYHQNYLEKNPGGYTCHAIWFDDFTEPE